MSFMCVVPARYGSSRFKGKVMADIHGKPMVIRVAEKAMRSKAFRTIVATDSCEVIEACKANGIECFLSKIEHASGTDRVAEVASELLKAGEISQDTIVLNVQGDEPLIPVEFINQLGEFSQNSAGDMFTVVSHLDSEEGLNNPNIVKCARASNGNALYFSRAPIPFKRDGKNKLTDNCFRHIGAYAYTSQFLSSWVSSTECELEAIEKLEQLRALNAGFVIKTMITNEAPPHGVDTKEDLEEVRSFFKES